MKYVVPICRQHEARVPTGHLVTGHHEAVQSCKYFTGDRFYLINNVLSQCSHSQSAVLLFIVCLVACPGVSAQTVREINERTQNVATLPMSLSTRNLMLMMIL